MTTTLLRVKDLRARFLHMKILLAFINGVVLLCQIIGALRGEGVPKLLFYKYNKRERKKTVYKLPRGT